MGRRCACPFWVIIPSFFYQLFPFFRCFSGSISIRIDNLWVQIILEFSTNHFETMHTCSTWSIDVHVVLGLWSIDVHVVLGLSSHYVLSTFSTFSTVFFRFD